jgi:PTS system cellobiose-specific IIC component
MQFAESFPHLIYKIIQIPLEGLTSSVGAITVVAGLNGLLWWFGIHPTVVNSIINPLLNANSVKNLELFQNGQLTMETGNVGTIQMIDQFATIGGAGLTLGLVIAMIIVGRSSRLKTMTKLSAIPALFNINEPIIFGLPVIFNPLMIIPITLAPIISVLIAYVLCHYLMVLLLLGQHHLFFQDF